MQYMLLCYDDEQAWERAGDATLKQAMAEAARGAASTVAEEIAAAGFQTQWLEELAKIVQWRADDVLKLTAKP